LSDYCPQRAHFAKNNTAPYNSATSKLNWEVIMQEDKRPTDRRFGEEWIEFVQIMNPNADPKSIRLMDEVRKSAHSLYLIGENSLAAAELSYAKYRLLMSLLMCEKFEGRRDLNPSEISERQGTSRNTISGLIRDLEADQLIERYLDPNDKRKFHIRLTEEGRVKVRLHANHHFQRIADCFDVLDDEEKEILGQMMRKLRNRAYRELQNRKENDASHQVDLQT